MSFLPVRTLHNRYSSGTRRPLVEILEGRCLLSATIAPAAPPLLSVVGGSSAEGSVAASSWTWQSVAPSPIPRFESAAEATNGKLYVFGGFINTLVQATTRSDAYNPVTNTWTRIADMPEPLTHTGHALDAATNTIWFAGGFVGDEGRVYSPSTAHVWKYNVAANTWSAGPDLPSPRGAGALVLIGRTLHYFGGLLTRAADQAEHWTLDIDNGTQWISAPSLPVACNHLAGISLGGKVYAIGGQHLWNEDTQNVNTVQIFDPATNQWTMGAPLPVGRGHIADSTFVMNNQIIVVGGAANGIPALRDVLDYDPVQNTWTKISSIPFGRRAPVARAINGKIIVGTGDPGNVSATTQIWIGSLVTTKSPWSFGPSMPVALSNVSGGMLGTKMYVVGQGSAATLVYDTVAQKWSTAATRPFVGADHAAVTVSGKLYLIGGIGGGSEGKLQIYDPSTNHWTIGPSVPAPFTAGASSAVVIGGKIYVVGGIIGNASSRRLASFDPATNRWTQLPIMPNVLNHAAAGTDGKLMYVFGGRSETGLSNGTNAVEIYDPTTRKWISSTTEHSPIPPLPAGRSGMGQALFWGGKFYVLGGQTISGSGSVNGAYNRVDIYNPLTHSWSTGPAMPSPAGGIFPILFGNNIFVAGGGTSANGFKSTTLMVYSLTA